MSGLTSTSGDPVQNNLPVHLTTFVGRERELRELADILATTRLLTVTGTGGCGKSRLASRLGREVLERYPDGAWWLELAPVSDPTLVEAALAAAIGVRPLPGRTPLEASIAHLADCRAVVLLDNCEHVLDPCRYLVAELLRGCPDVSIVATSREPLGVGGETTWRVPSLSLPNREARSAESGHSDVAIGDSDAVKLFVERAKKVRPEFSLSAERAALVSRICEELDGIPLAIELAAVRVRVLPLERIAAELADRFRLLTGGERGVLPRLQTIRSSVDWSYELLDPQERTMLRRCGIFSGGFTLEAFEAVCASGEVHSSAVLDVITSLVDKSLLLVDEQRGVRFAMLETIRQYALERLVEAEELDAIRERHADTYLALAETTTPNLGGDIGSDDVLGADAANIYAAIEHLSRSAPERALRCCSALAYWWLLTGRLVEGPAALTRALDAARDQQSQRWGSALFWRGYLAFFAGDYGGARSDADQALSVARELGDEATEGRVLNALGLLETQSDPRAALPLLERACELAHAANDQWCLAEATQNIGWARLVMGQYADACEALADAFEIAERNCWRELVSWHLLFVGHTQYVTGDLASARALWERGLKRASDVQEGFALWSLALVDVDESSATETLVRLTSGRERMIVSGAGLGLQFVESGIGLAHAALGNLDHARVLLAAAADQHSRGFAWMEASTLRDLARVARLSGDDALARTSAERALKIAEHLSHVGLASQARTQLAALAGARGEWANAADLVHQALRDQVESGDQIDVPASLEVLAEVALGLERFSDAARVLGAATRARSDLGRAPWLPEAARLDELRLRARAGLAPDAFSQAWTEGAGMTMTDAIDYVRRARGIRQRPSHGWESLTPTELAIVRHVAAGLTNPEIAERMLISRGTVKVHLSNVYTKVGLRNRSEVAAEVIRRNLLEHP